MRAWDSVGDRATETFPVHDFTRATVHDPAPGTQTPANADTGYNIFCAGFAHLIDGSLFIAGRNKDAQLNARDRAIERSRAQCPQAAIGLGHLRDVGAALRISPLLADGSVLATGGNSTAAALVDMNGGVYNANGGIPRRVSGPPSQRKR